MKRGRVLIVGIGGLGAPAALTLAAAQVCDLTLIDNDIVSLSNLHRQILFSDRDIGAPKVMVAAHWLRTAFPGITVDARRQQLVADNVVESIAGHDFIIDGTDNPDAKFLLNDAAVAARVPLSHAGVSGWQAQTFTIVPRSSACLRCLFPDAPDEREVAVCQTSGVIGGIVGSIGAIQASQALAWLNDETEALLTNRLLTCDARRGLWRTVPLHPRPGCKTCGASLARAAAEA